MAILLIHLARQIGSLVLHLKRLNPIFIEDFSNMISFLLFHLAWHITNTHTKICFLCLCHKPSTQFVNMSLILVGPCILKVKCIARHKNSVK
jgi:hypothetical protein